MTALNLAEIQIGDKRTLTHTITQSDVDTFSQLTGDYNPIHVDPEYAKTTSFGRNVVHGMLTSSFISTMIGMVIPGPGSLWTSQSLEFLHPTYIADTIIVSAEVTQKSVATRMLVLEITIINQHGTQIVKGRATVKFLEIRKPKLSEEIPMVHITLITGASGGIGQAITKTLANNGHAVAINYLTNREKAETLLAEITELGGRAILVQGDVSKAEAVTNIFQNIEAQLGHVTSVVHCACARPIPTLLEELTWDKYQQDFNIQIQGAFNITQRALPTMKERKSGSFVFISSIFTAGTPPTKQSSYVVAKSALNAFSKTIAVELGPKGIRANVVSPGMTQTEMISEIGEKTKLVTKMNAPLRSLAEAEDVAGVVAFLLSSQAKHITGENIKVCGGLAM